MTTEGAPSALSKATAGLKSQVAVVLYKETGGVTILQKTTLKDVILEFNI